MNKELYSKFPYVLRNKLIKNEIRFPDSTKFEYDSLYVYRAVVRKRGDNSNVSLEDFKSYFELNKKPRGVTDNCKTSYEVSQAK